MMIIIIIMNCRICFTILSSFLSFESYLPYVSYYKRLVLVTQYCTLGQGWQNHGMWHSLLSYFFFFNSFA